MLLGIVIAMCIAVFMGTPILPVLVAGAILQTLLAYSITKRDKLLQLALGTFLAGIGLLVVPEIFSKGVDKETFEYFYRLMTWCTYGIAVLTLINSTAVGLFGLGDSQKVKAQ